MPCIVNRNLPENCTLRSDVNASRHNVQVGALKDFGVADLNLNTVSRDYPKADSGPAKDAREESEDASIESHGIMRRPVPEAGQYGVACMFAVGGLFGVGVAIWLAKRNL